MPVPNKAYPKAPGSSVGVPDTFSWGSFDRIEPEPDPTHESHDLNSLSQHLLNTTAFTPNVSMDSGNNLPYSNDINKAYNTISQIAPASTSLFDFPTELVDLKALDYDRIGIAVEYRDNYFIFTEFPTRTISTNKSHMFSAFVPKHRIGTHLVSEWESEPKQRVGKHCIVAVSGNSEPWHVHSKVVREIRLALAQHVRKLERKTQRLIKKGKEVTEDMFKEKIEEDMKFMVETLYEKIDERRVKRAEEAEDVGREFLVFEDDDGSWGCEP